ncbi:hypothetical protein LC653_24170 [Nostoc sp. CHAB 5784]|uniref:hypothetical protein n=1 Tax=Nostoc mirabile TaxID=2907820 RepID=UPI001E58A092|nr:hypothetical protein [Nostoc mirabile]MCC5666905.1 hypothetical protein [Nostoc mirabile CHAB5784]
MVIELKQAIAPIIFIVPVEAIAFNTLLRAVALMVIGLNQAIARANIHIIVKAIATHITSLP